MEDKSDNPWNAKRIVALVLTLLLCVCTVLIWRQGGGNIRIFVGLGVGIVLGFCFVIRVSLPDSVYRASDSPWNLGGQVTADDDPRNISPRVYLPILAAVLVIAGIAIVVAFSLL